MTVQLREMSVDDLPALWQIFREIIREGVSYPHDESTTEPDFVSYWTARGGEQWVAVLDDRVVGGYTLRSNQPGRGGHTGTASYVVAEEARGKSIGRALGEHSLLRAPHLGFSAVQFNLVVSTNERAVALWRGLGFRVLGTLPRAFEHRTLGRVDAFVMYRETGR